LAGEAGELEAAVFAKATDIEPGPVKTRLLVLVTSIVYPLWTAELAGVEEALGAGQPR
jgi:hypothetical protein